MSVGVGQLHAPPAMERGTHLRWDIGLDIEPTHARVGGGQAQPKPVVGLTGTQSLLAKPARQILGRD